MTTLAEKPAVRGLEWLLLIFGVAALYVPTVAHLAMGLWKEDDQMHGPIILAVVLYLFWTLRHDIDAAPVAPRRALGWALFVPGLLFYILGRSQDIIIFELGSLIWILPALLLMLRGTRALRIAWFPIFFVIFMIPWPGPVVDLLTLPMKTFVSWATEHILYALGYPISRSGVILYLGQYQLLVADACAGLHTLFSLEAMGLFYLHITRRESWLRNTLIALLIVPISLTANTIRVLSLCLITYHFGDEAGQGFLHGFAGMVLFLSALVLIMALDALIQWAVNRRGGEAAKPAQRTGPASISAEGGRGHGTGGAFLGAALATALLMAIASGSALALRPTHKLADDGPKVDLEAMIPKQFGNWRINDSIRLVLPAPDVQARLDKIYNQTLARAYVNDEGQMIMLAIAYGGDQSDTMQVHLPEVCYASQGFEISRASIDRIATDYGVIPIKRLLTKLNERIEPITYWITVGDEVVNAGYMRKLAQLRHGLGGSVPDGMLVRVSSFGDGGAEAYRLQEAFLRDMLAALAPQDRKRIAGQPERG
ncbi:MAG TPA: exosortase B [Candidatus Desulfobacillus sp.]|nr:exosortase B [Candidatus Desulfobacillus sp.]